MHFVAVDYMGCPAVLSKQQRQKLSTSGLQLQPAAGMKVLVLPCLVCWMKLLDSDAGANACPRSFPVSFAFACRLHPRANLRGHS